MRFLLASASGNDRRGFRYFVSINNIGSIGRMPGNFVQSVGDGAGQLFYAFAGSGGDGMEFKVSPSAKIAQRFQTRTVGRSVELRSHHDQRLFRKSLAESRK